MGKYIPHAEERPEGASRSMRNKSQGSIEDFFGCLERPGTKALSIKEIAKVAAQGWAGERG